MNEILNRQHATQCRSRCLVFSILVPHLNLNRRTNIYPIQTKHLSQTIVPSYHGFLTHKTHTFQHFVQLHGFYLQHNKIIVTRVMLTTNLPLAAISSVLIQAFTRATTASNHSTAPSTSFSLELNQQCEGHVTEYIHSTELNTDSPHNTILGRLNYQQFNTDSAHTTQQVKLQR